MGLLILLVIIIFGSLPTFYLLKNVKVLNPIPYFFLYGSIISAPFLYFTSAYIFRSLLWGIGALLAVFFLLIAIMILQKLRPRVSVGQATCFIILTMLFFFVSNKTFQYHNNAFYIASNLYADMGVHVPVIRSFSTGGNLPFELPFFGGKQLTYHFFYDFLVGILEYTGVRIDIAYNLIFSLAFASLFFVCIDAGKIIFKKKLIGIIAFILFILPSDLSFISVLQDASKNSWLLLWRHNIYMINSFLGERTMGGFLYLNTYLNQRHLFFALTASLALFIPFWTLLTQKNKAKTVWSFVLVGFLIGFLPLWNVPIFFIMSYIFIILSFMFRVRLRNISIGIFVLFIIAAPQLFLITNSSSNEIRFEPGYLVHDNLTVSNFVLLWILNLGLAVITIMGGFIISGKNQKKLFLVLFPLFIIPNLFQITRHMFDNHKFFNFWFLFMCFFSASFILSLVKKKISMKILVCFIFVILTLSGFLNLLVVKNDVMAVIPDYAINPAIKKINLLIPYNETIITNGEIFDPLSVSGRKTYLGRINDIYSFGGQPTERIYALDKLFIESRYQDIVHVAKKERLRYIIIYKDVNIKNLKHVKREILDSTFKKLYEDNFGVIFKI